MDSQIKSSHHSISYNEVLENIGVSTNGLSYNEASARFKQYGPNIIEKKSGDSVFTVLWRQINNPLIWVLLVSTALAMVMGKLTDGLVVLAVVVVNTIIGFIQEYRAGKAIEALGDMVPENASVIRDGQNQMIQVSELVPGDIVLLAAGDRVPADMRLIHQKTLLVEEAALTGESLPSAKSIEPVQDNTVLGDRKCMVYGGTLVTSGTATAVVVATGMSTELGKISNMLNETTNLETPLTKKLATVGNWLTIGIVVITLFILVIGTYRSVEQGVELFAALKESLIFAIALAVGAIPEGLPAVVTIALAIGVQRMAKRQAIIRKLPAVETLGSTTVICSDKTGTLTRNEMTVNELWTLQNCIQVSGVGYNLNGAFSEKGVVLADLPANIKTLLSDAVLCNDANIKSEGGGFTIVGDPTEVAIVVGAAKTGIIADTIRKESPRIDVIPFDSAVQYMATLNGTTSKRVILKGAPEVIMKKCIAHIDGSELVHNNILAEIEKLGEKGMRVLAVAHKDVENESAHAQLEDNNLNNFLFIGLIGMIDPPRIEAVEAIKQCHEAGIVVKMITGDHKATARSIGMELGLSKSGEVVTGVELATMDDDTLLKSVQTVNIFARVAPEHKLRLVKALQKNNQIVAMTGDGVNDAPSLKQSNIGIAMGITGTSVSKESADIVLANDNFASISAAVEEGRRVYDNLLKSLAFLLPTNLGLALILIYGILFFPFNSITKELLLPMLPTQLLWINLVGAIALALPLAFEVMEPNVMKRKPRRPDEPLFNRFITFRVVFVSILMTIGAIWIFSWHLAKSLQLGVLEANAQAQAQTIAVTFVVVFQIFYMFNCRSLKQSILSIGLFSNKFVFIGIGTIVLLQAMFIYTPLMQSIFNTMPLSPNDIAIVIAAGFLIFPIISIEKWVLSMWHKND